MFDREFYLTLIKCLTMNKVNLFYISVIAIAVTALQSCTKVGKNLYFKLPMQTGSVSLTIPPTPMTVGTATFGPATNSYNVDSFIKAQTGTLLGVQNITSVKIVSCVLTVNNPDAANNLQNFQSGYADFSSNTNSTPYRINIPSIPDVFSTSINLPVDTSAELSSYLGNEFNYSVGGNMRRATTIPLNCTLQFTFNVIVQG